MKNEQNEIKLTLVKGDNEVLLYVSTVTLTNGGVQYTIMGSNQKVATHFLPNHMFSGLQWERVR